MVFIMMIFIMMIVDNGIIMMILRRMAINNVKYNSDHNNDHYQN
jgi:hypothetical protein